MFVKKAAALVAASSLSALQYFIKCCSIYISLLRFLLVRLFKHDVISHWDLSCL